MSLHLLDVSFEWPNGQRVFGDLSFSLKRGEKVGLVGPNGVGKSTLAALICGDLKPQKGQIHLAGQVQLLRQSAPPPELSLLEFLGTPWAQFQEDERSLADQWLKGLAADRSLSSLSGGEWMKVQILRLLASEAEILILDEPTLHLDREGRQALTELLLRTPRTVLVISHEKELLSRVQRILELTSLGLQDYGGDGDFYFAEKAAEQHRQSENLERQRLARKKSEAERRRQLETQEKRMRQGAKSAEDSGLPKILLGARKRQAQQTWGQTQKRTLKDREHKTSQQKIAFEQRKAFTQLRGELPEVHLPKGKLLFSVENFQLRPADSPSGLWANPLHFHLQGPVRLLIKGANGSGKSSLCRTLFHGKPPPRWEMQGELRKGNLKWAYLEQDLRSLPQRLSVLQVLREQIPQDEVRLRNRLADFGFTGDRVHQLVMSLSGGEKLRLALATEFLRLDPAEGLILDEPTNHLDVESLQFLADVLRRYTGALILICHDDHFVEDVGDFEVLELERKRP